MTKGSRRLRSALNFYPDIIAPDAQELEASLHFCAFRQNAAYEAATEALSQFNVDSLNPHETAPDWACARIARLIPDVLIPGHRINCVDPATARTIDYGGVWRMNWNYARPMPALRQIRVRGVAIPMPNYRNYWHLIVEGLLPTLYALQRFSGVAPGPVAIVAPANGSDLFETILGQLPALWPGLRILRLRPFETARADHAIYCRGHFRNKELSLAFPEALEQAKTLFRAAYRPAAGTTPSRLYIRRGVTRVRRVHGEDELAERLRLAGFNILTPDWTNHREQFNLAANARFIAGVHGAGLTNCLWAAAGATLCEIMAFDARKRCYLNAAAEARLNYLPMFGGPEQDRQNFAIDAPALASQIIAAADRACLGGHAVPSRAPASGRA